MDADPRDIASLLRSGVSIPAETVRRWMNLPDLNVQGLAFDLLFDHPEKVEGSMSDEERDAFFLRYLEQCLRNPADGEYAHERYMAGDELRAWFQRLWKRRPDTEHTVISIREMLRRACLEGDAATRDAVIIAVLEHLFVDADVAAFFRSWERDARLREIYIASLLRSGVSIPAETVRRWMNLPDLNVQGLAFELLFDHPEKVEGSMSDEERDAFFLRYLEQCLRNPADGEYAHERYMAGDELRAWFQRLWKRRPDTEHTVISIREMLRRACLEGDAATRDAVITAVLEHLFVDADVAAFFRSWERDARLREIYKEAIDLASSMQ